MLICKFCIDIVNCWNDDACHENATCTDYNGSYTCVCKNGFTGHGFNCTGEGLSICVMNLLFVRCHWLSKDIVEIQNCLFVHSLNFFGDLVTH